MNNEISEEEMIEALKRSGYLLESEISSLLAKSGFFVESNQVIQDPITGKSREIDLLAELNEYRPRRSGFHCNSTIKFVFEMKNNLYPLTLLTQFESSPNIEDWTGLKEVLNLPQGVKYEAYLSYYENLIGNGAKSIFTQYCSYHKKRENDDLMALHPDNLHAGLMKIVQYCEEQVELFDTDMIYEASEEEKQNKYFRHNLYMPVLLINDDLYEYSEGNLQKTESSILVFNYHFKGEAKMAYVFVITKNGFNGFMENMIGLERECELKMENARIKSV